MSKAMGLIAASFCFLLAGVLVAADEPKQEAGKKDPVEVTGRLFFGDKRIGEAPFILAVRSGKGSARLPLIVDGLKDWTRQKYLKADHVRVTGTLEMRKIEVQPGMVEERLALVANSMVMIERKPNPPPQFPTPLDLPQGVMHVALPPGIVTFENIVSKGKPTLRVTFGGVTIDTERLFVGDGRIAVEMVVDKEGMYWPSSTGAKGLIIDGSILWDEGEFDVGTEYVPLEKLKPGSLYLTTPSTKFITKPRPDVKR